LKLDLKINIGNGNLYGRASNDQSSYRINIQEASEKKIIIPTELRSKSRQGPILFETETGNEVYADCSIIKQEEIDMILLYTDIDTLIKLTKDIPTTMELY
jgi:hypothetical protein